MPSKRTSPERSRRRSRSGSSSTDCEGARPRRRRRSARDSRDHDEADRCWERRSASPRADLSRDGRRDEVEPPRRRRSRSRDRDDRSGDARNSKAVVPAKAHVKSRGPLPSQAASFQSKQGGSIALAPDQAEKQKPNFAPTGLLAAASNTVAQANGTPIVLKYHEPPEARKPSPMDEWKLFVFKGSDLLDTIELSLRSCWLVGREAAVVDLFAEHPTISNQHAVVQFRYVERTNEYGDKMGKVKPYLIDLDSANATRLNKQKVPPSRYVELRNKDMIQFGHSTRDYVLMLSPKDG